MTDATTQKTEPAARPAADAKAKLAHLFASLAEIDPAVQGLIDREIERQGSNLELIASENHASRAILEATASVFTNKYAEGYPGKRYYGGCEVVDELEQLAIDRAKELFGAEYANVQPHSGSSANMTVYFATMPLKGRLLTMDLGHGGHLSHGMSRNFSGAHYTCVHYGVSELNGRINLDDVRTLARVFKPEMIVCGASAYPRRIDFESFRAIADEVGALLMADIAHVAGLVATGLHPDPVPVCDFVTSTTHKTLRGPRSGTILCKKKWGKKIDSAMFPGLQGGPLVHVIAAKAVAFYEAMQPQFKDYCREIIASSKALANELLHKDYKLVTGGTDNHMMLVDLSEKNMTGRQAQEWLEAAGLIVNKNTLPFDKKPIRETSGIRIGTPSVCTRGLTVEHMPALAGWIDDVLAARGDEKITRRIKGEVREMCKQFPTPH